MPLDSPILRLSMPAMLSSTGRWSCSWRMKKFDVFRLLIGAVFSSIAYVITVLLPLIISLLRFDEDWDASYAAYLAEAGCPFELSLPPSESDLLFALEWLLGRAVELEWQDFVANPESSSLCAFVPSQTFQMAPELDPEICDNVRALASELGVPIAADIPLLLQVCCRVICQLCPEDATIAESSSVAQALDALPLGFCTGDATVDRAAKVLRLLYIADLRDTQNHVNEAISRMQQYTADPKTDSRLGRVGH
jgi:RLL motif-containing protein 1